MNNLKIGDKLGNITTAPKDKIPSKKESQKANGPTKESEKYLESVVNVIKMGGGCLIGGVAGAMLPPGNPVGFGIGCLGGVLTVGATGCGGLRGPNFIDPVVTTEMDIDIDPAGGTVQEKVISIGPINYGTNDPSAVNLTLFMGSYNAALKIGPSGNFVVDGNDAHMDYFSIGADLDGAIMIGGNKLAADGSGYVFLDSTAGGYAIKTKSLNVDGRLIVSRSGKYYVSEEATSWAGRKLIITGETYYYVDILSGGYVDAGGNPVDKTGAQALSFTYAGTLTTDGKSVLTDGTKYFVKDYKDEADVYYEVNPDGTYKTDSSGNNIEVYKFGTYFYFKSDENGNYLDSANNITTDRTKYVVVDSTHNFSGVPANISGVIGDVTNENYVKRDLNRNNMIIGYIMLDSGNPGTYVLKVPVQVLDDSGKPAGDIFKYYKCNQAGNYIDDAGNIVPEANRVSFSGDKTMLRFQGSKFDPNDLNNRIKVTIVDVKGYYFQENIGCGNCKLPQPAEGDTLRAGESIKDGPMTPAYSNTFSVLNPVFSNTTMVLKRVDVKVIIDTSAVRNPSMLYKMHIKAGYDAKPK